VQLPAGIHGISDAQYFALPHISKSGLDCIHRSPAFFKWTRSNPSGDTDATRIGTAGHKAILEWDEFPQLYVQRPKFDRRYADGKRAYEEWSKANAGKRGLDPDDWSRVMGMREAVMGNIVARQLLAGCDAEMAILWQSPYPHVQCKAKADALQPDYLIDLKTTKDCSQRAFRSSFEFWRYHVQLAFYLDGLHAVGFPRQHAVIIAVENEPPHHVAIYAPDAETIEMGRKAYKEDLAVYARCLEQDYWPGMPENVQTISLVKRPYTLGAAA
jgi:hypothetical protein